MEYGVMDNECVQVLETGLINALYEMLVNQGLSTR